MTFSKDGIGSIIHPHVKEKNKIDSYFQTCSKINSRLIVTLNVMYKTLNLPEVRREEYFHGLEIGKNHIFRYH